MSRDDDIVPVLDFGPVLRPGGPTEEELGALAQQLKAASQDVGFFFLAGAEGVVPRALVDEMFALTRKFHALDLAAKTACTLNMPQIMGYLPNYADEAQLETEEGGLMTASNTYSAALFFSRGDGKRFDDNPWPDRALPELRAAVERYDRAMRELAERMLPVYERAIGTGLPPGTLKAHFTDPHVNYRLAHYPITPDMRGRTSGIRLYGANPHADVDFFTILAPNAVPGLSIQLPSGEWLDVPARPGTFVVNTGEMLYRLTNGRFRNTVHQVINKSGGDRNAVVFFLNLDRDFLMTPVLETPAEVPKWPPFTSLDVFMEFGSAEDKGEKKPEDTFNQEETTPAAKL